jgi:hypothetical protein
VLKRLFIIVLVSSVTPIAKAEVSTRVCLADGNTPLEFIDPCSHTYRPIMVGTHLSIIVYSDADGMWEYGELSIWDSNQSYGDLNCIGEDCEGSKFPAAGDGALVYEFQEGRDGHDVNGFMFSGDDEAVAGDWFIIDYNAISIGDCQVVFYDSDFNWEEPKYEISFTHVPTRDFDDDGIVGFSDFDVLGLNWLRTDCQEPDNCSGTDFNNDGIVNFADFKLFADFWLERTR